MARGCLLLMALETVVLGLFFSVGDAQFFSGFYRTKGCADAEAVVTQAVTEAFNQDPGVAPALLRMLFHDCFVEGCDASLLLDPFPENPSIEKLAEPNLSVRGYEVIDEAKRELERICPRTVSCADIVALAARDAVVLTGGQMFEMPTGRLDGMISSAENATNALVSATSSASELTQKFSAQGLGQDEMITLSGAHTVGRTSCAQITSRLYAFPGAPNGIDPSLDFQYALHLQDLCPADGDPTHPVPLDPVSPDTFDNMFYTNGVTGRVLFASDNALFADRQTMFASSLNSQNAQVWQVRIGEDAILETPTSGLFGPYSTAVNLLTFELITKGKVCKCARAYGVEQSEDWPVGSAWRDSSELSNDKCYQQEC